MEADEWVKRYLQEAQRLGQLNEADADSYHEDAATVRLRKEFPNDPEGAAIYVARFADRIPLGEGKRH